MLADGETFGPLWHQDVTFAEFNAVLESIPFDDLSTLDGLELESPHHKLIPFVVKLHPEEVGRLEFKLFEATHRLDDYHAYFLLWLALLLDDGLQERASKQSRVYDLGTISRLGLVADEVQTRATEMLRRVPAVLQNHGLCSQPLDEFFQRLKMNRLPCDEITEQFQDSGLIVEVLRTRTGLAPSTTNAQL